VISTGGVQFRSASCKCHSSLCLTVGITCSCIAGLKTVAWGKFSTLCRPANPKFCRPASRQVGVAGHCMELWRYRITSFGWHSQLSKFGSQCWEVHSNRLVCPSDGVSLSSLTLHKLWDKYRQTDTYANGNSVFLSAESCLLCSVCHRVKALHSAVSWVPGKARGGRDFLLTVRLLGCDTVRSDGNTADLVQKGTAAVFRAERLIFVL